MADFERIYGLVDKYSQDIIGTVRELLAIKSEKSDPAGPGKPFGDGIAKALGYVLDFGRANGFETKNTDGYAGHIGMGSGDGLVGILGHLDTVPAGSGWSVPAFDGTIKDGRIYGRGATDDKGPTVCAMWAMKIVAESGCKLGKRVRLIVGTDEESDWEDMDHYFRTEEKPHVGFSPDASFPVINGEKGIAACQLSREIHASDIPGDKGIKLTVSGGERVNIVPDSCLCTIEGLDEEVWFRIGRLASEYSGINGRVVVTGVDNSSGRGVKTITAKGVAAHGSLPELGVNAISVMVEFLLFAHGRLGSGGAITDRTGLLSLDLQAALEWLDGHFGFVTDGSKFGIAVAHDILGALTMNFGMIRFDGSRLDCSVDIRFPVGITGGQIAEAIKAEASPAGFELSVGRSMSPIYCEPESELVQALTRAYEGVTGEKAELITMGGTTYAKALPMGVAFGPVFPGRDEVAHQKDEYIYIDDLIGATKIYARAIIELAGEK